MKTVKTYVETVYGVGILLSLDSRNLDGKYAIETKNGDIVRTNDIKVVTKEDYDNYKPTKQPAKRGSKKQ